MNTPIGKINELPIHFKEGSNNKALIKYENYDDYLCFWRCLSYHKSSPKPKDNTNINKMMNNLFKNYVFKLVKKSGKDKTLPYPFGYIS